MVSSSTKDRGEALWESLYRSTNGCCMWLGNIPDEEEKDFIAKTAILHCDLAASGVDVCFCTVSSGLPATRLIVNDSGLVCPSEEP